MDKPKDPDSPERPESQKQDQAYMSPRLRSKLSAADDLDLEEAEKDTKAQNMMALGMLAVLVVVGAFLVYSIVGHKSPEAKAPATPPAAAAEAPDSTAADSLAKADSTAMAAQQPPKPKPAPKPVEKKPEAPPTPFGIAVGSYIDQGRAKEELTKLQGSTGLTGQIQPFDDGGITSYRVVLGSFDSRGVADSKANDLIDKNLVYEARVMALK